MILAIILFVTLMCGPPLAWAQPVINYSIETLDPPYQDLRDLNKRGDILVDLFSRPDLPGGASIILPKGGDKRGIVVDCPGTASPGDTEAQKIDNYRNAGGSCFTMGLVWGFVRYSGGQGHYQLYMAPSAEITLITAVNDRGWACGQYYEPVHPNESGFARIHGFCHDGLRYITLDFPGDNTVTAIMGVTNNEWVLGAFFDYDPVTNIPGPWHWFFWKAAYGFIPIAVPGAQNVFVIDLNNDGSTVIDTDIGYYLYDDNILFRIGLPATTPESGGHPVKWTVKGFNDDSQLTGIYSWSPEPFVVFFRGFVATPLN